MRAMKMFFAVVILLTALIGVTATAVYNTSVNSEMRFVPRVSHEEYINTRRSYRPRVRRPIPTSQPVPNDALKNDDAAEEVEP